MTVRMAPWHRVVFDAMTVEWMHGDDAGWIVRIKGVPCAGPYDLRWQAEAAQLLLALGDETVDQLRARAAAALREAV